MDRASSTIKRSSALRRERDSNDGGTLYIPQPGWCRALNAFCGHLWRPADTCPICRYVCTCPACHCCDLRMTIIMISIFQVVLGAGAIVGYAGLVVTLLYLHSVRNDLFCGQDDKYGNPYYEYCIAYYAGLSEYFLVFIFYQLARWCLSVVAGIIGLIASYSVHGILTYSPRVLHFSRVFFTINLVICVVDINPMTFGLLLYKTKFTTIFAATCRIPLVWDIIFWYMAYSYMVKLKEQYEGVFRGRPVMNQQAPPANVVESHHGGALELHLTAPAVALATKRCGRSDDGCSMSGGTPDRTFVLGTAGETRVQLVAATGELLPPAVQLMPSALVVSSAAAAAAGRVSVAASMGVPPGRTAAGAEGPAGSRSLLMEVAAVQDEAETGGGDNDDDASSMMTGAERVADSDDSFADAESRAGQLDDWHLHDADGHLVNSQAAAGEGGADPRFSGARSTQRWYAPHSWFGALGGGADAERASGGRRSFFGGTVGMSHFFDRRDAAAAAAAAADVTVDVEQATGADCNLAGGTSGMSHLLDRRDAAAAAAESGADVEQATGADNAEAGGTAGLSRPLSQPDSASMGDAEVEQAIRASHSSAGATAGVFFLLNSQGTSSAAGDADAERTSGGATGGMSRPLDQRETSAAAATADTSHARSAEMHRRDVHEGSGSGMSMSPLLHDSCDDAALAVVMPVVPQVGNGAHVADSTLPPCSGGTSDPVGGVGGWAAWLSLLRVTRPAAAELVHTSQAPLQPYLSSGQQDGTSRVTTPGQSASLLPPRQHSTQQHPMQQHLTQTATGAAMVSATHQREQQQQHRKLQLRDPQQSAGGMLSCDQDQELRLTHTALAAAASFSSMDGAATQFPQRQQQHNPGADGSPFVQQQLRLQQQQQQKQQQQQHLIARASDSVTLASPPPRQAASLPADDMGHETAPSPPPKAVGGLPRMPQLKAPPSSAVPQGQQQQEGWDAPSTPRRKEGRTTTDSITSRSHMAGPATAAARAAAAAVAKVAGGDDGPDGERLRRHYAPRPVMDARSSPFSWVAAAAAALLAPSAAARETAEGMATTAASTKLAPVLPEATDGVERWSDSPSLPTASDVRGEEERWEAQRQGECSGTSNDVGAFRVVI